MIERMRPEPRRNGGATFDRPFRTSKRQNWIGPFMQAGACHDKPDKAGASPERERINQFHFVCQVLYLDWF